MAGKLVRMLSTGRNGTKFMASAFADQGYLAFHEDLYVGEPFVAIKHYLNWLGDLWMTQRETYYALDTRFTRPYGRAVQEALESTQTGDSAQSEGKRPGVVIHSAHLLTTATPLVQREFADRDVDVLNLVLLRNPLRTIHAIYTIESQPANGQRAYRLRPASFFAKADFMGAAQIWANTYRLIADLMDHYGHQYFRLVWLERFSSEPTYTNEVFDFLDLEFDSKRFFRFTQQVLGEPLRASKTASVRNSDLYIQPDFSFDEKQIEAIQKELADVVQTFDIDWDQAVEEYVRFHDQEKEQLGFSRAD
jgi:hypothetical protein